jgi:hypothetical protein
MLACLRFLRSLVLCGLLLLIASGPQAAQAAETASSEEVAARLDAVLVRSSNARAVLEELRASTSPTPPNLRAEERDLEFRVFWGLVAEL